MSKFMSNKYLKLKEYVPGEQPQDKKYIKLNTNESPYPPSPEVVKRITDAEVEDLRLYSDPECKKLKCAIAKNFGVSEKNIFVSNGSDETLNFFFMAFCDEEKKVAFPEISYGFYKVYADLYNLDYTAIPLNEDFSINPKDYEGIGKNVVIANPNAPTGLTITLTDIEKIAATNRDYVVLIDEAYVDFGAQSAAELTKKYDNLLVVQTFSKSRSLAGARLGFAIGNEALIADLEKIKYSTNPYNINRLTLIAGEASMGDREYFMKNKDEIIKTREYTIAELRKLGFDVTNSKANFVFAKSDKIGGLDLYLRLKDMGILIRHFNDEKIKDYNRITIGTKVQMEAFIDAVKQIIKGE